MCLEIIRIFDNLYTNLIVIFLQTVFIWALLTDCSKNKEDSNFYYPASQTILDRCWLFVESAQQGEWDETDPITLARAKRVCRSYVLLVFLPSSHSTATPHPTTIHSSGQRDIQHPHTAVHETSMKAIVITITGVRLWVRLQLNSLLPVLVLCISYVVNLTVWVLRNEGKFVECLF